jgi:hypothetical protein
LTEAKAAVFSILKGVAKKTWCFEFYNVGLRFLKENYIYPFLLLGI